MPCFHHPSLEFTFYKVPVIAAPLTGHATLIAQLEQRDPQSYIMSASTVPKTGKRPRQKQALNFDFLEPKRTGCSPLEPLLDSSRSKVGHPDSGVWGLEKVEKSYRQRDFLGFLRIEAGKKKTLYRAINEITGATKFEVLDHLMRTISSQSSDIAKFTSNYADLNAWNDVYLAMTDPIKYTKDGGTKWDVTPLLNALRQT
ncbi:hypothetical protein C8J55DRAFT_487219 [Lentinula edodes]|uniref:Uncharacterized protein n=1 Tax=Lentinula lateritia TaxID=40482 RepID=A0A9W9APN4_9AGAR|nr:hypothetical protein C8J55DRAFT_487219 [Lentinula edodes]